VNHSPEIHRHDEGAVLLLTLIFVVVIALVLLALVSLSGNDLMNTANLQSQRASEYAADSAVDAAMQAVRYSYYAFNGAPPAGTNRAGDDCLPDGTAFVNPDQNTANLPINGVNGVKTYWTVDCTGSVNEHSQNTRVITFYACTQSSCSSANAIVTAVVAFQDYSTANVYDCDSAPNVATCGTGVVIQSWTVRNANS
jgi:Tfp pilus assembly protein PilX